MARVDLLRVIGGARLDGTVTVVGAEPPHQRRDPRNGGSVAVPAVRPQREGSRAELLHRPLQAALGRSAREAAYC